MVAHDLAREAGEDRRPDRAPRPLRGLPARRGGGAASAVRRDPAPDRPLARTAHGGGLTGADHGAASVEGRTMRRRSVEPAGSRRADLRRGLASPTPTVAAALAGLRLTHNPSRSTVEPENGGYLGDVGSSSSPWSTGLGTRQSAPAPRASTTVAKLSESVTITIRACGCCLRNSRTRSRPLRSSSRRSSTAWSKRRKASVAAACLQTAETRH